LRLIPSQKLAFIAKAAAAAREGGGLAKGVPPVLGDTFDFVWKSNTSSRLAHWDRHSRDT
jgi:hypothetical protein